MTNKYRQLLFLLLMTNGTTMALSLTPKSPLTRRDALSTLGIPAGSTLLIPKVAHGEESIGKIAARQRAESITMPPASRASELNGIGM